MYFLYTPNTEAEKQRSENKEQHSLVGLAPEVDFINIVQTTFMCAGPKSAKRQSSHQCLFALLRSVCVKSCK